MTDLHLDYEVKSPVDLTARGLDVYAKHPETKIILGGWALDNDAPQVWDKDDREPIPSDLKEALRDPSVNIWAFNAQFERWITNKVLVPELGIDEVPVERFFCSQVLAYMFSFMGGLGDVNAQMGAGAGKSKLADGKRLVRMFCMPNKPTKKQPFVWRDRHTDPEDWHTFKHEYLPLDIEGERDIKTKLLRFGVHDWEWDIYHVDQIINDRGLPINREFVENALAMADLRKAELISRMKEATGCENPNSGAQLLPWLQDRGYPFGDLQKETVAKVLKAEADDVKGGNLRPPWLLDTPSPEKTGARLDAVGRVVGDHLITQECRDVMYMRQGASRSSTTKYDAALNGLCDDDYRLRHCFQFAGASRTNRWAGRKIQPQNFPRTPKFLEPESHINFDRLDYVNDLVLTGNYSLLALFVDEPMDAIAGVIRSAVQAPDGKRLTVCDLSSIESVVSFWLTGCERGLNIFRNGLDIYKDFASVMFKVGYDEVAKWMRQIAKPAVLGACYRLSGGRLENGKRTGLWGYAEDMGVDMTLDEAQTAVDAYRSTYPEVVKGWYAIEDAIIKCLRTGKKQVWRELEFEIVKPFLRVKLPSGRYMWYYKARVDAYEAEGRYGPYTKYQITYMGKDQVTQQWCRIESHGGKFFENFVQALARDILAMGMMAAHKAGFWLVGHVHDELISEEDEDDEVHTWQYLRYLMAPYLVETVGFLKTMPLNAAGYHARVYHKD